MQTVTEAEVKYILMHKDRMLENLQQRRYSAYRELAKIDRGEDLPTLSSPGYGLAVQASHDPDLYNDMARRQKLYDIYEKEIKMLLYDLREQEETVLKVWYCFTKLPEPYYSCLDRLYVKKEPYKKVLAESGYPKTTFRRYRKKAIDAIIMFYDYDYGDLLRNYRIAGQIKPALEEKGGRGGG